MLSRSVQILVGVFTMLLTASPAMAQRGVGEPKGVARRAVKPQTMELTGTVCSSPRSANIRPAVPKWGPTS